MHSPTVARRRMTDRSRRTRLLEREAELEQIGAALRTAVAGSRERPASARAPCSERPRSSPRQRGWSCFVHAAA